VNRRLARIPLPDESGARDRAWRLVGAAYSEREAVGRPRRRVWPLAAAATAAAVVAAALTPPGMAVLDSIRRAVGVEHAERALYSLPAIGRILAVSQQGGAWVVHPDGSKRRLGDYRDAAWSPHGRFVAATTTDELRALEDNGKVHWTLARRGIASPSWGGTDTDTRIAYTSQGNLRIVAGDGTGDRLLSKATRGPYAWRPGSAHDLAYVAGGQARLQNTDTGKLLWHATVRGTPATGMAWSGDGRQLLVLTRGGLVVLDDRGREVRRIGGAGPAALSPKGDLAYVRRGPAGSSQVVLGDGRRVFSGTGDFTSLAWSPDGRWLLMAWPTANQWVFVRVAGPRKIAAAAAISRQFGGSFPTIRGWCCAP